MTDRPDDAHTRPDGLDDATVDALGTLSEALEVVERVRTLVDERLEVAKVEARETWGPPEELDAVLDRAGVIVKYRDVLALLSAQGSGGAE